MDTPTNTSAPKASSRAETPNASADMNVTPLIDVLLVLLDHLHGRAAARRRRASTSTCRLEPSSRQSSRSTSARSCWSISPTVRSR